MGPQLTQVWPTDIMWAPSTRTGGNFISCERSRGRGPPPDSLPPQRDRENPKKQGVNALTSVDDGTSRGHSLYPFVDVVAVLSRHSLGVLIAAPNINGVWCDVEGVAVDTSPSSPV